MYNGAIIGFGKIARTNHVQAYKSNELKNVVKINAVVEPNEQNRIISQEEFPELKFYDSLERLFKEETIDFVDIAAPPNNHFEILEKCIEKNIHIICEKPFTINSDQAERIKQRLLDSNIVFVPCHQYKYSPVWKEFKNFIDVNSSESKVLAQFNVFRTEADPGLKQISQKWRTGEKDLGGGILADTGVHYLYLASWMLGKISRVSTQLLNLTHSVYRSEDTALVVLEGEKGIAQITLTWAADKRFNSSSVVNKNSSLYYYGGTNMVINSNPGTKNIIVPDMSDKANYTAMYVNLFTDFFEAVKQNKKNIDWIEEAYQTVCLMDKCYTSAEEERTL